MIFLDVLFIFSRPNDSGTVENASVGSPGSDWWMDPRKWNTSEFCWTKQAGVPNIQGLRAVNAVHCSSSEVYIPEQRNALFEYGGRNCRSVSSIFGPEVSHGIVYLNKIQICIFIKSTSNKRLNVVEFYYHESSNTEKVDLREYWIKIGTLILFEDISFHLICHNTYTYYFR